MNMVGLFVMGVVVTLIVGAALGFLVWAAIQDGRDDALRQSEPERLAHGHGTGARTSPA